jgi:osmotically inducible protein OsmC
MAIRTANARWEGTLTEGSGVIRTGKGGLSGNYSFKSRFEEGEGTNPEELIGAAHAGCYSMALSAELTKAGFPPAAVDTTATVHFDRVDNLPTVTRVDLVTSATVPNIDDSEFQKIAEAAKSGCPISRLLAPGAEITLSATLN